ncbi:MAG: hypothetical protein APR63_14245 [Desulfuromonas sp. SDB]|nr:MAG: hypothetical protein APR63_14245 [Desulfuromonas sp. SDB]
MLQPLDIRAILYERYCVNKLGFLSAVFGFIILIPIFYFKIQLGVLFYILMIIPGLLFLPILLSEEIIGIIILFFLLFSSISAVFGRLVKPSLLLLMILLIINYLHNNWKNIHWSRLHLFIAIYIIAIMFSLLFTFDFIRVKIDVYDLLKAIVYFFLITEITILCIKKYTLKSIEIIFNTIILACVVGSVVSIYFFIKNPFIAQLEKLGGFSVRTRGWMEDPNYFAMVLDSVLIISYFMLVKTKSIILKSLYIISIILLIAGIILSLSRGGFFGLICVFLIVLYNERKKKLTWIILSFLIILFFIFFGQDFISRLETLSNFGSSRDESLYGRLQFIKIGIDNIIKSPIFGIGFGDFHESVTHFYAENTVIYNIAHNIWLQIAAETGLFGLFSYLGIIISSITLLYNSKKQIKNQHNKKIIYYVKALFFAQIIFFIPATFLSVHLHFAIWSYWALTVALIWGIYKGGLDETGE